MQKTLGPGAIGLRGPSLAEWIDLATATGFDSIVFDIREAAQLADANGVDSVRDLFSRSGVKPGHWSLPVALHDEIQRPTDLENLPKLAALGKELGCPRVATGVMPGSADLPFDENYAWHLEHLRPVAEILNNAGCRLGIEFIGPKTFRAQFKYEFVYSMTGMLKLGRDIGTGNVGLLLDIWHLYTAGENVEDISVLTSDDVVVVHVNDAPAGIDRDDQIDNVRALPLETGVLDLEGFMKSLQRIGYDGPVMPEPFSRRVEAVAAEDPLAASRLAADSMTALWALAGLN